MNQHVCFFHQERTATAQCQKCGRKICHECSSVHFIGRIYNNKRGRRTRCPLCFYQDHFSHKTTLNIGLAGILGFIILFSLDILIFIGIIKSSEIKDFIGFSVLFLLVLSGLMGLIYLGFFQLGNINKTIIRKGKRFLESLSPEIRLVLENEYTDILDETKAVRNKFTWKMLF